MLSSSDNGLAMYSPNGDLLQEFAFNGVEILVTKMFPNRGRFDSGSNMRILRLVYYLLIGGL